MEFIVEGMTISDPFMDETGRFTVDAVEYYGKKLDDVVECYVSGTKC